MSRKVIVDTEAVLESLFWPEVDLRKSSNTSPLQFSENAVIRPKFIFKNADSTDINTLVDGLPSDLYEEDYVLGLLFYFNGRSRKQDGGQIFPLVILLTVLPKPCLYMAMFNSGSSSWYGWYKTGMTFVDKGKA